MQFDERTSRILTDWADSASTLTASIFNQFKWHINFEREKKPVSEVPVQFQVRLFLEKLGEALLNNPKPDALGNLNRLLVQKNDGKLIASVIVGVLDLELYGFKEEEVKEEVTPALVSFDLATLPPGTVIDSSKVVADPPTTIPNSESVDGPATIPFTPELGTD